MRTKLPTSATNQMYFYSFNINSSFIGDDSKSVDNNSFVGEDVGNQTDSSFVGANAVQPENSSFAGENSGKEAKKERGR